MSVRLMGRMCIGLRGGEKELERESPTSKVRCDAAINEGRKDYIK